MFRFGSLLRLGLVLAALVPSLIASAPPARANDTGALIGGLVAGALVGSAVTAATRPKPYYYYGAPPYPPCRTPVY